MHIMSLLGQNLYLPPNPIPTPIMLSVVKYANSLTGVRSLAVTETV